MSSVGMKELDGVVIWLLAILQVDGEGKEEGGGFELIKGREIHPLDPQPHRHSMLVPRVCAPRVTRCGLGKYWSRDWFRGYFSLTQGL